MPRLNLEGLGSVNIGDNFAGLSDEDKEAAINEIAAELRKRNQPAKPGFLENVTKPFTNYFPTVAQETEEGIKRIERGSQQLDEGEHLKALGNIGAGALQYFSSPFTAAYRQASEPIEKTTGIPKEYTEFTLGLATPGIGLTRIPKLPTPPPLPARPMGVTLSEGQLTRDLPQIQFEQAALRGQSGAAAQRNAQAFADQQAAELAAARGDIVQGLDPRGGVPLVDDAQEAAALAQRGVQGRAADARAGVRTRYETAKGLGGEIHAGAFEGMPQRIKGELTLGDTPVIIDDKLTPFANQMIRDLEANVGKLRIPNAADPFGAPAAERITGVNLTGVEQWRKRLSTMRGDAMRSGNAADARAARAVLEAFDNQIDNAVNSGLFSGDPRAVQAWNAARAAFSDYRSTFGRAGPGDQVGRVIEKIIGRADNPAAIPNDVADFIYGTAGTNPSSLNVAVVNRLRNILGERSPEWTAIKQGLFTRLTEAGEGMTAFGPGKTAQRINKFLNVDGREMAQRLFSPVERNMMQQYADLLRHLEVPQAGANWSNTATFAGQGFRPSLGMRAAEEIGMAIATVLGGPLGHLPLVGGVARRGIEAVAAMPRQAQDAARIARQMPVIANVVQQHTRAQRAFTLSPSARNAMRVTLAGNAMAETLGKLGITLDEQQPQE